MKVEFDIQERPKDMGIKRESSTDIYNLNERFYKNFMRVVCKIR